MSEAAKEKFSIFNLKRRLSVLQKKINDHHSFKDVSALAFIEGSRELLTYNKTSAMQEWLFGQDILNTFVVISKSKIAVISNKFIIDLIKEADFGSDAYLETFSDSHYKNYDFGPILEQAGFDASSKELTLGIFEKDNFDGKFADAWYQYLTDSIFKKADVSYACSLALAVKDDAENSIIKDASRLCDEIYTKVAKPLILDCIDEDKIITHSSIARDVEESLDATQYHSHGMKSEDLESPFPPIIQSGGECNVKYSTTSDHRNLKHDCIVIMFGIRYRYYCTSIARTLMVRPSEKLKQLYEFVLSLFDLVTKNMKIGNKFCEIYNTVYKSIKQRYPEYSEHFFKTIGFVTGLEFRENAMIIDSKNTSTVDAGMVFIVLVGFQNISISDYKTPVTVAISDTVQIDQNGQVNMLTTSKRSLGSSSVILAELPQKTTSSNHDFNHESNRVKKRLPAQETAKTEEQRKIHQAELKIKLNEEARKRLTEKNQEKSIVGTSGPSVDCAYKSASAIPAEADVLNLKIYIDKKAESVILPVCGMSVPFHISTIKSVTSNVESNYTYLRINFHTIVGSASKMEDLSITYGKNIYVKEMIFRSPNKRSDDLSIGTFKITNVFNQIKELQKSYKARLQQEIEMRGVIKQADLILNTVKNVPRLKDVQIRPLLGPKKSSGTLEAHVNGFRYISSRAEKLDILYENIRYCIFQPCDHETSIFLHFHLKAHIMIGKRKFKDVQFFAEACESVTDLGKMSSSFQDKDELEAEEQERETRNRLKVAFKTFIERVEAIATKEIEFEVPIRELGFNGVPHKTSCFLMPTTNCLINITEQPPFVVSLDDIELVHFERIDFGMKNFDMVIVYKDYREKVSSICSIDIGDLEGIKDWLNSCDIKYTESKQNLNWAKIMKTILDDPEDFFVGGGWSFLDPESDEANDEHQDSLEDDEEYKPNSSEELYEESDSGSDENYVSENSESDFPIDSDESESGKSWSELETEARMDDAYRFGTQYSPTDKRKSSSRPVVSKRRKM